jgi:hypothetical protein
MTYKEIINRFRTITENHLMLQDFGYGDLSDLKYVSQLGTDEERVSYPYLYLLPSSSTRNGVVMNYSFNMIVMDMARPEDGANTDKFDNYITIQSQCQQYIDDVLANLYYYYKDQPEIELTGITYTPFKEKYQDVVAGMTATITIQVPTPLNECIAPFDNWVPRITRRADPSQGPVILDFDGAPEGDDDYWKLYQYSYTGQAPWTTTVSKDAIWGAGYRSIRPNTTERYKLDFAMKTKWNEPEDGSGRLKYGIRIYVPGGLNIQKTFDIPWVSAETEVPIDESFIVDMVAGTEYYFLVGQNYAVQPSADISGYQLPGSQVTISTIGQ